MDKINRTKLSYGFLWQNESAEDLSQRWHFNEMQENIPERIARGKIGIDIGSGCGYDTCIMAKNNPGIKIISLDISDGIYITKQLAGQMKNVQAIKGSCLNLPARDNSFDFAYSYGVLHHTINPLSSLKEIFRILKPGAPVFLYLYESHCENPFKYLALKTVSLLRTITIRIPPRLLYLFCRFFSPVAVILFSYPSRYLKSLPTTRWISEKMPFNFATNLFSLTGDLYDRFSAPIEYRFSKNEVLELFNNSGFSSVHIRKFESKAGWIAWGYK